MFLLKSFYHLSTLHVYNCGSFKGKSKERKIKVCFDKPAHLVSRSPGLLKKKRKRKRQEEDAEESQVRTKRIRFNQLDSSGSPIDPQFSDDEDDGDDRNQSHVIVDNIIDSLISFALKN